MAQELELIVDLLKEMKRVNNTNMEGFDRLLANISSKLDSLDGSVASTELLKAYLGELTKNVEDKYSTTITKFTDIEQALRSIFLDQQEHVHNKDMKELFDIFSKNMNGFYTEAKQQKALLSGIESRLSDLSNNKSDKEDILRTITLLRNDFENLNHAYKNTIDEVNSNLKGILTNLIKMDQTAINTEMKEQLDNLYKAASDIVNYLKSIDEKDAQIEKVLANVATSENLKIAQGVLDSIIQKTIEITASIENLSDKKDIEGLQAAAVIMNNKLDEASTKEDFSKINLKTESLLTQAEEVKQTLAEVTKNIEELPNTTQLEESLAGIFQDTKKLQEDIEASNLKKEVNDIENKINNLTDELTTVKNIIEDINEVLASKILTSIESISFENETYDIKEHVSKMVAQLPQKEDIDRILEEHKAHSQALNSIIEKTDIIQDKLDNLPTHQDIEILNNNQLGLIENLQAVATKEDFEALSSKSDEIEDKLDNLNFDNEFEHIYDKTSSIEEWLEKSKIKEKTEAISEKLEAKSEQKDLLELLNLTKNIIKELEELSENADVKKVNRTVSDIYQMIDELKTDLMNTQEMHNDSIIVQLSELQKSISNIVTAEEFSKFIDELKDFIQGILNHTEKLSSDFDDVKKLQDDIIFKLENLDVSNIKNAIESATHDLKQTIEEKHNDLSEKVSSIDSKLVTISEYLNNGIKLDDEALKATIQEIREVLQNKKSSFDDIEKDTNNVVDDVHKYISEIKNLLESSNKDISKDVKEKLTNLENIIVSYKAFNENNFEKIIDRLSAYENLAGTKSLPSSEIIGSISELREIKDQILQLGETFNSLTKSENLTDKDVSSFISDKLNELGNNLNELSNNVENGIQQGFAYNAELIEEKTTIILGFIKELRHASTEDIDLFERLTVTDNKLMDLQQELELINTDVINGLTSKTTTLIEELAPIKELINVLKQNNSQITKQEVSEKLTDLHDTIHEDLTNNPKLSRASYENLENTYDRISDRLTVTENNLRDFILGDVDSVIIKIDSLKTELEEQLNRIAPPDAGHMAEFHKFIDEINDFKQEQKDLLTNTAEDIKTSLSEKMEDQHDEIKSLLTVAVNNEEIINAIEDLKKCFKSRIKALAKNADEEKSDEFATNEYEEAFEENSKSAQVIEDIKQDFNKFSDLINNLSGENPEIEEVLNTIKNKIDTITIVKSEPDENNMDFDIIRDEDDEELPDENIETIVGENNFDFIKAFDLLKQDITKLRTDVEKAIPQEGKQSTISSLSSIPKLGNDNLLINLNNKIDVLSKELNKDWLEEIKGYIAGSEIQSMLEDISGKIDILTLTDNSEWIEDIKNTLQNLNTSDFSGESNKEIQEMLELISQKIDILASSDDYDLIEDVRDSIEASEEIKETLNLLDKKVDIIATSSNEDEFEDIHESLENIETKIDEMSSLSGKSEGVEGLQDTLSSIESKIDVMSLSDNTEDFEGIHSSLENIESKIDVISQTDNTDDFEDIHSSLENIESKIDVISQTDNTNDFEDIHSSLENIESKIDVISQTDNTDDFENIHNSLENIESKIDIISQSDDSATLDEIDELKSQLENLSSKVDVVAQTDYTNDLDEIKDYIYGLEDKLSDIYIKTKPIEENVRKLSATDAKLTSMLETLNHKIDEIFTNNNVNSQKEFEDIKHLIFAQSDFIKNFENNSKTEAFKKCLKELTLEVNNLNLNSHTETKQVQKSLKEMKESIMAAVVTIFNQVSFIEESEDIKDFVEERTDEINQNLEEVTKQLKQITSSTDETDYNYSMQDIESDLAKLRLALNELQNNELESQSSELANISDNVYRITSTVEELQNSMTQDEIKDIKSEISNLREQTQKILASSDESYNAINNGLEDFSKVITNHLTDKVDKVTQMLEKSSVSDKVMRQALIYMGEWIDSASESMDKISSNSEEIVDVKNTIEKLKKEIPEQTDILNSIEEKFDEQQERLSYFEKQISKLGNLEEKFEQQEERIDRLEMTIEKILSAVEDIDDSKVSKKIDKLDKQLAKLSMNIEKLTAYVD